MDTATDPVVAPVLPPGPAVGPSVRLSGPLTGRCSAELRELLTEHLADHPDQDLVLDLSEVDSVDLTVLRLLSALALRVERAGHRVVLRGCSPMLRRVFTFGTWRRLFWLERGTTG